MKAVATMAADEAVTEEEGVTVAEAAKVVVTEEMKRAFEALYNECDKKVKAIVRDGRVPDPGEVIGQTWEHVWRKYPRMYAEEQASLAAGEGPKHTFKAFVGRVATNRLIDYKRKLGLAKKPKKGVEKETITEELLERPARRKEVPLVYAEHLAAGDEFDPEALAERGVFDEPTDEAGLVRREAFDDESLLEQLAREAFEEMAGVEPMQYLALQTSLDKLSDAQAEKVMKEDRQTIYRLRQEGLRWLRRYFTERGFKVATSKPRRHL